MSEMSPEMDGGVPLCAGDDCPQYDGKRCRLTGFRQDPGQSCEPAVREIVDERDRLRARVAELEAERDSAHDCIVEMQTTIARLGQSADMAHRRGAESMRERAVAECEARARHVQDADMTSAHELRTVADEIRALPLDDDGGSDA